MSRLIQFVAAYALLQAMGGFSVVDRAIYGDWVKGDKFTVLTNFLAIGASLFLVFAGNRRLATPAMRHYLPFAVVGLLIMSAIWSLDPEETIKSGINYAFMVVGAMGMARALAPVQIMRLIVWVCAGAGIASLALYATPYGVLADPYMGTADFRGVFGHKNTLGEAMVAGVLAALYCIRAVPRGRKKYIMLAVLFVFVILAAKSATSFLTSACYIFIMTIMALHAKGGMARVASYCAIGFAGLGTVLLAIAPELIFELLGKDPTLTGRTELWPYVWAAIAEKPLMGWGFNGFWFPSNSIAARISDAVGWVVPQAHNGLLELLLQVGIVGSLMFVALFIRNCWLATICMLHGDRALGEIVLLFAVGLFVIGISEAILLTPSQMQTLQFFLFGFLCDINVDVVTSTRRRQRSIQWHQSLAIVRNVLRSGVKV